MTIPCREKPFDISMNRQDFTGPVNCTTLFPLGDNGRSDMKRTKTAISALILALALLGACGHDHHATTAGGGTGITGQTTLQGNLTDGSGPVSDVQVCILGANPAVCATTDGDGNFSVADDLVGQVI